MPRLFTAIEIPATIRQHLWPLAPGGPDGTGWPLGRAVDDRMIETAIGRVPGVRTVSPVHLFARRPGETRWRMVPEDATGRARLPLLDDILVCCHTDSDRCDCRKPSPGMLLAAAKKHGIDLSNSFMVGDRWRDIDAGYNAGCRTILIDYGYSERAPEHAPDLKVKSLREAADWIIRSTPKGAQFGEVPV